MKKIMVTDLNNQLTIFTQKCRAHLRCKLILAFLFLLLSACTHFAIEDCGGKVLGSNEPRIRSSHFRMFLEDESAATNRFLPFAAMSALAYAEDKNCGKDAPKVTLGERQVLEKILSSRNWQEVTDIEWVPPCEDDVGLFYRVWNKEAEDHLQVVVAIRGTWETKDWFYGNLHWFTGPLQIEDQYSSIQKNMEKVFSHFSKSNKPIRFFTTGHSLGGGLAQHALYSFPTKIIQAIAFDPSSVTGFLEQPSENQVVACECDSSDLNGEARIYRIYDAYEILSNLRIFHKIFFPPERHVQEIRFPNKATHSMKELAFYMQAQAEKVDVDAYANPWYSGKGQDSDSGMSCTNAFENAQRKSCSIRTTADQWFKCPQ